MAITPIVKETGNEDYTELRKSISLLKKEVSTYKEKRKSAWKKFKTKFHGDLFKLEQSLKTAKAKQKKHKHDAKR